MAFWCGGNDFALLDIEGVIMKTRYGIRLPIMKNESNIFILLPCTKRYLSFTNTSNEMDVKTQLICRENGEIINGKYI